MKKLSSSLLAILNRVVVTILSQSKNSEFQIQGHYWAEGTRPNKTTEKS